MVNKFKAAEKQKEEVEVLGRENREYNDEINTVPKKSKKNVSLDAILDTIETKDECKNYTFYLKKRNMERLAKLAKAKKISVSKLLDSLISNLLGD